MSNPAEDAGPISSRRGRIANKMRLSEFEIKQIDAENWQVVSEKRVLRKIVEKFDTVTPVLLEMFQGKEITIADGTLRIKNWKD